MHMTTLREGEEIIGKSENSKAKHPVLSFSHLPSTFAVAIVFQTKEISMADVANRYPENIAGKFYVDNQCIDCDLCRETAPDNFKRNEDGGYSFVYKQPESPEEEARCKEAKEGCPVEAIGDNGA
jgi:ferredoxin